MNEIKVEVGQYREVNKGTLKAFFSLLLHPYGQKIIDCRYFEQGEKCWFSFPQKEIKYADGRKTEYIPYVSYIDKEYLEKLKIKVLKELKDVKQVENNDKEKNQSYKRETHTLQGDTSFDFEQPPF